MNIISVSLGQKEKKRLDNEGETETAVGRVLGRRGFFLFFPVSH